MTNTALLEQIIKEKGIKKGKLVKALNTSYSWLKKKINISDEALAEAYIKTDYSTLSDKDFETTLKKLSLYKYMEEKGLMED